MLEPRMRLVPTRLMPGVCPYNGHFQASSNSMVSSALALAVNKTPTQFIVQRKFRQPPYTIFENTGVDIGVSFSKTTVPEKYPTGPLDLAVLLSHILGKLPRPHTR